MWLIPVGIAAAFIIWWLQQKEKPADATGTGINRAKINEQMLNLDAVIRAASGAYNVPVEYIKAIIKVESDFNPYVTGKAGEIGLMQLLPATAEWLDYKGTLEDLYLPSQNVKIGTKYLRYQLNRRGYGTAEMAAGYNAGTAFYNPDGTFKNQAYVDKFFKALKEG